MTRAGAILLLSGTLACRCDPPPAIRTLPDGARTWTDPHGRTTAAFPASNSVALGEQGTWRWARDARGTWYTLDARGASTEVGDLPTEARRWPALDDLPPPSPTQGPLPLAGGLVAWTDPAGRWTLQDTATSAVLLARGDEAVAALDAYGHWYLPAPAGGLARTARAPDGVEAWPRVRDLAREALARRNALRTPWAEDNAERTMSAWYDESFASRPLPVLRAAGSDHYLDGAWVGRW